VTKEKFCNIKRCTGVFDWRRGFDFREGKGRLEVGGVKGEGWGWGWGWGLWWEDVRMGEGVWRCVDGIDRGGL